jgi:hypothetical protein
MTQKYRILIDDRDYTKWELKDPDTNLPLFTDVNPVEQHLFSKDVFQISEDKTIEVMHSLVRCKDSIYAGVLQLATGKTFGRTANKKRLLYKCIPDDIHLPIFLVPYEVKLGFEKTKTNKYVVFRFDHWTDKHPNGILVETLGNVDNLDAFYEYQLYCKSLHISINEITRNANISLMKKTHEEHINQIIHNPNFAIVDRRKDYVFTIDPTNSVDFDDGFSISRCPDGRRRISIYIANVFVWLETLGLWSSFSNRVATIYLPDRRRPMLPTVLSDSLCSLQENQSRFVFIMDIILEEDGSTSIDDNGDPRILFSNGVIKVAKNYRYEEDALFNDTCYKELLLISKLRDKRVLDSSHDIVAYWMVQMNSYCAEYMANRKIGIFRAVNLINKDFRPVSENSVLSEDAMRIIQTWNNTTGQYVKYGEGVDLEHGLMQHKSYIHITSPIRRLVDLLNQMIFAKEIMQLSFSKDADEFLVKWLYKMEYVNISMRSIRKIQTECELLHKCSTNSQILNSEYNGIVFDKMVKNNGAVSYMVYLEDLKLLARLILPIDNNSILNYSKFRFKVFLFEDEDKTKRKIRLQLLEN